MHLSVGIDALTFPTIPRLSSYFMFDIMQNTEVLLRVMMDALMTMEDEWGGIWRFTSIPETEPWN
jgi:hypothetical protein